MRTRSLLNLILKDDALTRGLGDAEARVLIEWLASWAERFADGDDSDEDARRKIELLRRRGRAIRQFVELWCHRQDHGAAIQLAATERFRWPLPDPYDDPWLLMHSIMDYEDGLLHAA